MSNMCTQLVRDGNMWNCLDVNQGYRGLQVFQINTNMRGWWYVDGIPETPGCMTVENTYDSKVLSYKHKRLSQQIQSLRSQSHWTSQYFSAVPYKGYWKSPRQDVASFTAAELQWTVPASAFCRSLCVGLTSPSFSSWWPPLVAGLYRRRPCLSPGAG